VAAGMIQADRVRFGGRYRVPLSSAFVQRGILAPGAAASLRDAPPPQEQPVALDQVGGMLGMVGGLVGTASIGGFGGPGEEMLGATTLLTYGDEAEDEGFRFGGSDLPELPLIQVPDDLGLGLVLQVHGPAHLPRFGIAPAALEAGPVEVPPAEQVARYFLEDLVRLNRIELDLATADTAEFINPARTKTHRVVQEEGGPVVKRLCFDCGCGAYRG